MTVSAISTRVRTATAADAPRLAAVLARAFFDDPAGRWFFPAEATRARGLERMFGAMMVPAAIGHGQAYHDRRDRRRGAVDAARRAR